VAVNTGAVADGDYTLGLRATDAAGNSTITRGGPVAIRNQAPAPGPVSAAPAAQDSGIRITHFDSSRTLVTERLIRYGSRATLRGVLRNAAGQPMPSTQLDVVMRTDRKNSWLRKVATLTTDSNGRFEYKTPPGPSRLVRFGYGASSAGSSYSFSHDVKVNVRSGVRMSRSRKSLRNGQHLRLYGTIRGIKQRKAVEIQVRKAGGWDTIASVRSDSKGRWSWRYRFERTYKSTRYTFRARVRAGEGFPYATGYSPSRSVRVR
jgi:5-hydroxyisourate hydrolase-like protein (transthyretin family)